ncbi:MAG: iron-containing alcohol dehydrogenase [Gemmataceae bacterium]|nr:iron-containing alcohol dehydrogenase [Gemmataceae bacterium]
MKATYSPTSTAKERFNNPLSEFSEFEFTPLNRVVAGPGALDRLGILAKELGAKRVLLVTDPGLEKAGHPQKAQAVLEKENLQVFVFDGVEENPQEHHVELGVEKARAAGIDTLVALGGGSSMDCAKGINFLLTNGGKMADYRGIGLAKKPMLPSLGIPTTAGTGSEAQSFALITDSITHLKMACGDKKAAFRICILDPELTVSQPAKVTAATGIDAMAHAIESHVTLKRNPLSQAFSHRAWQLLVSHFPKVLENPGSITAREGMQTGAHFAGHAIENSMLGICHSCANPLTAHYGIPHGVAIGILLPWVIRYNQETVGNLYQDLALEAGMKDSAMSGGEFLAQTMEQFQRASGLPGNLNECKVAPGILNVLAEEASQQWTAQFNPRPADQKDLLKIYQAAMGR